MRSSIARGVGLIALGLLFPACSGGGSGTLTPTTAPGIPTDVMAIGGNGRVTLHWASSGSLVSFTVSRSLDSGGPYFPISQPGQFPTPTSYLDLGLQNGTPYYYIVTATNQYGTSPPSAEAAATPKFAVLSIAQGSTTTHTLVLFEDGSVWGWGVNNDGQVGNGIQNLQSSPAQALNLPRVTALARGTGFSLGLGNDGTVWTWGSNVEGSLGRITGPGGSGLTPGPVLGIPKMTAIAAGNGHALALTNDGIVWAWGSNNFGELGQNTSGLQSVVPSAVGNLSGVTAIAGGNDFSLALKDDGTVWGWGINDLGTLGNGTTTSPVYTPVQVKNLNRVVKIVAGGSHALALRSDGTIWAWGYNGSGQLGDGVNSLGVSTPIQVLNLQNVISIAAGSAHSLAVRGDGTVWAWGDNEGFGALGNGSQNGTLNTPTQVPTLTGMAEVAGGYFFSLALKIDGTVWSWGENSDGALGIGSGFQVAIAATVNNLNAAAAVAAGGQHGQALRSDGTVWGWGANNSGQLGNGGSSATTQSLPGQVLALSSMTATSAGSGHGMALKSDGTVWTWGSNASGQVGNGTVSATPVTTPVQVTASPTVFTAVSAGGAHSLALKNDGTVWAWGSNSAGQIGNGTSSATPVTSPSPVLNLTSIKAISAGTAHNLALRSDGSVWAWGMNSSGQVGTGAVSGTPTTAPVQVLTGMSAVAAGDTHSLAVATDGTIWSWGSNSNGELGTASGPAIPSPLQISGLGGMSAVSAGSGFSLALRSDGSVWGWGGNSSSELGDGTTVARSTPAQVVDLAGVTAISAGPHFAFALDKSGLVWAWGLNVSEQLGTPYIQFSAFPVVITQ